MDEQQNQNMPGAEDAPHAPPEMTQEAPEVTPQAETVTPPAGDKTSFGPIFGIIIIVILLVLAGFYFWGSSLSSDYEVPNVDDVLITDEVSDENTGAAGTIEAGSEGAADFNDTPGTELDDIGAPLSESDEIEDLEAELDSTVLDELDAELEAIDEELTF